MESEWLRKSPGSRCRAGAIVDQQGGSNRMIRPCAQGGISCAAFHPQARVADEPDWPNNCCVVEQFTGRPSHETSGHTLYRRRGPRPMRARRTSEPFRVHFCSCGSVWRNFASPPRPLSGSAFRPPPGFRFAGLLPFLTASDRTQSTRESAAVDCLASVARDRDRRPVPLVYSSNDHGGNT